MTTTRCSRVTLTTGVQRESSKDTSRSLRFDFFFFLSGGVTDTPSARMFSMIELEKRSAQRLIRMDKGSKQLIRWDLSVAQ